MASIIFDFDSTLIQCESLEEILKAKCQGRPELQQAIAHITELGMNGQMSFAESLQQRLQLAAPDYAEVMDFAHRAEDYLSPGMHTLIQSLHLQGIDLWIMSGALRATLLPLGQSLGIGSAQILGVEAQWSATGKFLGLGSSNPFADSKLSGAKLYAQHWSSPSIIIGDGITDYQVYEAGLTQHFIAYCQHVKRPQVVAQAPHIAHSVAALQQCIEKILACTLPKPSTS